MSDQHKPPSIDCLRDLAEWHKIEKRGQPKKTAWKRLEGKESL